jgi:hypothetical protein
MALPLPLRHVAGAVVPFMRLANLTPLQPPRNVETMRDIERQRN